MITVYWSCNHHVVPSGLRAQEPVRLQNHFFGKYSNDQTGGVFGYQQCPSVRDFFDNLYGLKMFHDYRIDFNTTEGIINCSDHAQDCLERMLLVRNMESALFSWQPEYIFFTDAKSLELEVYPAFMESNDFVNKTNVIPGVYDIGKWFRPLDCPFHLKQKHCSLQFSMGDVFLNLRFRTKEKIKFKYFTMSRELSDFIANILQVRMNKNPSKTTSVLSYYYDLFTRKKLKKQILKLINEGF